MKKQNYRFLKIIICSIILLSSLTSCAKSENEGAEKYKNGRCVAFYPSGHEASMDHAMKLCENGDDLLFDYKIEKAGDYFTITYGDGTYFYVDKDLNDLTFNVIGGAKTLSNILRYEMKKDEIDEAYTSGFWLNTDKDELNLEHIDLHLEDDHIDLIFNDFDYSLSLPKTYLKKFSGKDLGFGDAPDYEFKEYISMNRPMVALTYDDGPYRRVDEVIYEALSKYNARATFYSVGSRMSQNELENIAEGIELGMEYGSHTENHANLSQLDAYEARYTVMEPVNYLYNKLGYQMKTYRPPYGSRNYDLEDIIDMPAILWTVDTKDWANRDEDTTYYRAIDNVEDGDVVLMHSLYMSSAYATERIVPELIDMGFQLVTVSELLTYKGYDLSSLRVYGRN